MERCESRMKKLFSLLVAVAALLNFTTASQAQDIVDTAAGNKDFSTLVTAVKAAGLVDTLKGAGPFTVFAPTNAAFAKLPKGTVESLLKPENKAKLQAILKHHVVSGKVLAADVMKLKNGSTVTTVNGDTLVIRNAKGVTVGTAKVVKTDIVCDNGVIHVIDSVLLPAPKGKMMKKPMMKKPMMDKMGK